jgi:di/tricarboxylate transporter
MTPDQITLISILVIAIALFLWGKWRFDLVAFGALMATTLCGLIPFKDAFSGFGQPATITVAEVLIISRALKNSGIAELINNHIKRFTKPVSLHIGAMCTVGAFLSSFMNNVGTITLLMPTAIQSSLHVKRSPSFVLMPLSFATILGGLVTLIGTPPNIIIASYRQVHIGQPFNVFDFSYVGLPVALAGVLFVSLVGWRLLPQKTKRRASSKTLFEIEKYLSEATILKDSKVIGETVAQLKKELKNKNLHIVGVVRNNKLSTPSTFRKRLQSQDILIIEGIPESFKEFMNDYGIELFGMNNHSKVFGAQNKKLIEVIISQDSVLINKKVSDFRFYRRFSASLIAVERHKKYNDRLSDLRFQQGDTLLFYGEEEYLNDIPEVLDCIPLAERDIPKPTERRLLLPIAIFACAIGLTAANIFPLQISLGIAVAALVFFGVIPVHELYKEIEWPVIVLIASFIPIGYAFETTGLPELIVQSIFVEHHVFNPLFAIAIFMALTMTLTDVMNNTATSVIMAPVAVKLASQMSINPDALLMAVAVSASCSFLTPIGHQNNVLVMGPGGYQFGDYWRMGLPLEIIILLIATPLIYYFWV